jgi:hypothetical protein
LKIGGSSNEYHREKNVTARRRSNRTTRIESDEDGYYGAYVGFARELRVWFLAYGIGGPAIFLTNDAALKRLLSSGSGRFVAYAFLSGVVIQVAVALLYKSAMWYLYMGELSESAMESKFYKAANWISDSYWIEAVCDVFTLVLFGGATLRLLNVFSGGA